LRDVRGFGNHAQILPNFVILKLIPSMLELMLAKMLAAVDNTSEITFDQTCVDHNQGPGRRSQVPQAHDHLLIQSKATSGRLPLCTELLTLHSHAKCHYPRLLCGKPMCFENRKKTERLYDESRNYSFPLIPHCGD